MCVVRGIAYLLCLTRCEPACAGTMGIRFDWVGLKKYKICGRNYWLHTNHIASSSLCKILPCSLPISSEYVVFLLSDCMVTGIKNRPCFNLVWGKHGEQTFSVHHSHLQSCQSLWSIITAKSSYSKIVFHPSAVYTPVIMYAESSRMKTNSWRGDLGCVCN